MFFERFPEIITWIIFLLLTGSKGFQHIHLLQKHSGNIYLDYFPVAFWFERFPTHSLVSETFWKYSPGLFSSCFLVRKVSNTFTCFRNIHQEYFPGFPTHSLRFASRHFCFLSILLLQFVTRFQHIDFCLFHLFVQYNSFFLSINSSHS